MLIFERFKEAESAKEGSMEGGCCTLTQAHQSPSRCCNATQKWQKYILHTAFRSFAKASALLWPHRCGHIGLANSPTMFLTRTSTELLRMRAPIVLIAPRREGGAARPSTLSSSAPVMARTTQHATPQQMDRYTNTSGESISIQQTNNAVEPSR